MAVISTLIINPEPVVLIHFTNREIEVVIAKPTEEVLCHPLVLVTDVAAVRLDVDALVISTFLLTEDTPVRLRETFLTHSTKRPIVVEMVRPTELAIVLPLERVILVAASRLAETALAHFVSLPIVVPMVKEADVTIFFPKDLTMLIPAVNPVETEAFAPSQILLMVVDKLKAEFVLFVHFVSLPMEEAAFRLGLTARG